MSKGGRMPTRSFGRSCAPLLFLLLPLSASGSSGPSCDARPRTTLVPDMRQGATQVGEEVRLEIGSPAVSGQAEPSAPVWSHEISHPGASYIAPRFARVDLPPGARLVVRTPDGK